MTESTPFLHLTILADGQVVHREQVDIRDLGYGTAPGGDMGALGLLADGHLKIAERLVAGGHRVQVRLADPDGLAGTAVIDMVGGTVRWKVVGVDPDVEAAWRAGGIVDGPARRQEES